MKPYEIEFMPPSPAWIIKMRKIQVFLLLSIVLLFFFAQIWMDSRLQKLRKFKWVVGCSLKQ